MTRQAFWGKKEHNQVEIVVYKLCVCRKFSPKWKYSCVLGCFLVNKCTQFSFSPFIPQFGGKSKGQHGENIGRGHIGVHINCWVHPPHHSVWHFMLNPHCTSGVMGVEKKCERVAYKTQKSLYCVTHSWILKYLTCLMWETLKFHLMCWKAPKKPRRAIKFLALNKSNNEGLVHFFFTKKHWLPGRGKCKHFHHSMIEIPSSNAMQSWRSWTHK